jgi:hypothetical protein
MTSVRYCLLSLRAFFFRPRASPDFLNSSVAAVGVFANVLDSFCSVRLVVRQAAHRALRQGHDHDP